MKIFRILLIMPIMLISFSMYGMKEAIEKDFSHLEEKEELAQARTPLFDALNKKDNKTVITLLDAGASVNTKDSKLGRTPLMVAANLNNTDLIKELLQRKANLGDRDKHGNSALFYAARAGNLDAVKMLVAAGADINNANENHTTPLIISIRRKHPEIAKYLMQKDASVLLQEKDGVTSLMVAADRNSPELLKLILAQHADPNIATKDGATALHFGAIHGPAIIKPLLQAGAQVNTLAFKSSPLNQAIRNNNPESIELLLQAGAPAQLPGGNTQPLIVAVDIGNAEIVKRLLKAGAKANAVDDQNFSVLAYAIQRPNAEIVEVLINAGADPSAIQDIIRERGTQLLFDAEANNNLPLMLALVKLGADINAYDNNGRTVLLNQIERGNFEGVGALLKAGADPNKPDSIGYSPLSIAIAAKHAAQVRRDKAKPILANLNRLFNVTPEGSEEIGQLVRKQGSKKIVEMLVRAGADINAKDPVSGGTPLVVAAFLNDEDMVKLLLELGADKTIPDNEGRVASDFAKTEAMRELLKYDPKTRKIMKAVRSSIM